MTITEYYENYRSNKKYPLTLSDGSSLTIEEFYDQCMKQNILPVDNVLRWHKMLLEYAERADAVFWVRYYESGNKKSGRWNNRRACKTEFADGFSYVFVSNFDVHEIFNMVRLGVVPDAEEFANLMKTHQFYLHSDRGKSCEETDICSYPTIGSTRAGVLTAGHWYLAHIIGIKTNYYDRNGSMMPVHVDRLYPRGLVSDWGKNSDGFWVRKLNYSLSKQEKELVKAHFLRFVDPLNYYLVPGKYYQMSDIKGQIGESDLMNAYVSKRFEDVYGMRRMKKFRELTFASPNFPSVHGSEKINITYGPRIKGKTTGKAAPPPKPKNLIDFTQLSKAYLDTFKVGAIANQVLRAVLENGVNSGKITRAEIDRFKTERGKNSTFKLSLPLLALDRKDSRGTNRYYKEPIVCYGEILYINSQWPKSRTKIKEQLVQWIVDRVAANGGTVE